MIKEPMGDCISADTVSSRAAYGLYQNSLKSWKSNICKNTFSQNYLTKQLSQQMTHT